MAELLASLAETPTFVFIITVTGLVECIKVYVCTHHISSVAKLQCVVQISFYGDLHICDL